MKFSAQQIAAVLGGALYGNTNAMVSDVAPIEQAQAQHLTFITDEKYLPFLEKTKAGVILITRSLVEGKIAFPEGDEFAFRGTMEGIIGDKPLGENGFGYDPIFFLPEYQKSSAELSADEKNSISHRGKALKKVKEVFPILMKMR